MYKNQNILKTMLFIFILIISFYNQNNSNEDNSQIKLNENSIFNFENKEIKYDLDEKLSSDIEIKFCPKDDCLKLYEKEINKAKFKIKCAIFELDEDNLAQTILLKSKEVPISLIIDNKYLNEKPLLKLKDSNVKIYSDVKRGTKYNNFMHNKFCVIDEKTIITGSTNPTNNGFYKNNNNIIKFESKYLAKNYENEFDQMASNIFGQNKKSTLEFNKVNLKFENENYLISSYFCPQDNCEKEILKILNKANKEILFATFVLTSNNIENKLIEKSKNNIFIEGVVENRNRNSKGSKIEELNKYFKVNIDKNKNNMHHKFFIIDEKYLITGSQNPSASGNKYNDENILIIENEKLAKLYKKEFLTLI